MRASFQFSAEWDRILCIGQHLTFVSIFFFFFFFLGGGGGLVGVCNLQSYSFRIFFEI